MQPLVSIITPVYNSEKYIEETIKSILLQTYKNWELILIDDFSVDKSYEIINKYIKKEKRIKYIKNIKNIGPADSRNIGIQNSEGKYIAFLDSDDLWSEDKLEKQIKYMEETNTQMTHSDYFFIKESGELLNEVKTDNFINYKKLLKGNQFKMMTIVLKKEIIKEIRIPNIKHEDYAFFLRILSGGIISKKVPLLIAYCRQRKKSVSANKLKSALWTWNIYYKIEKLGLLKSLYYFFYYVINGLKKYRKI